MIFGLDMKPSIFNLTSRVKWNFKQWAFSKHS